MIATLEHPEQATSNGSLGPNRIQSSALLFAVPPGDDSKFFASNIPWKGQQEIRLLLKALRDIHHSGNINKACQRMSALLQTNGARRGYSSQRLRALYYDYTSRGKKKGEQLIYHPGDWRILWNQAKYPANSVGLPHAFLEFWRALCENHQRVSSSAHKELIQIYRTRFDLRGTFYKSIPGYDAFPAVDPFTDLPAGWSYANLMRYAPDQFELTAARIGRSAAVQHRLPVLKTRVGLRVGEFFQFDDHEYNIKVNFPGQRKGMRPRGFTAADVLSGCFFKTSFKPTLWDDNEEKKRALTEREFAWFVIDVLTTIGFRNDERGTKLIVEWGTAAIRGWLEEAITRVTNGKVTIERSGKFSRPAHKGQFEGRSHGNFRFKALLECGFRIVDDRLDAIKGQVGKDRLHAPEQIHGAEAYNNKLLKAVEALPAERAALLEFSLPLWHEFLDLALGGYRDINTDRKHKLEGWEKLKFFGRYFRKSVDDQWLLPAAFNPDEQQIIAEAIQRDPEIFSAVLRLNRQEVFDAGKSELTPVPFYELPALLNYEPGYGREISVRNGLLAFDDKDFGSDSLEFIAVDERGQRINGTYLCFVNPHNPSRLVATDGKRVIALCDPYVRPCYNDHDGIIKKVALQNQWEAAALEPQRQRHAADARALDHMKQHNARILESVGQRIDRENAEIAKQNNLTQRTSDAVIQDQLSRTTETVPVDAEQQWD